LSWRVPGKPPKSYKRGRTWGSDVDGQTQNRRVGGTILQQAGETEMEGLPDCSKGFFCELLERVVLPKVLQSEDVGDSMIGEVARRTVDLAPCDKKIKGTADNDDNQSDAASLLPSVMFATFANTYGEMACLHLTQDSTLAVAGFTSSSSVLVWDWDRVRRNGPRNKAFEPCQFRHVYPHVKGDSLAASPVINEEVFTAPVDSTTGDKGITVSKIKDGSPLALIGHSERVHSVSVEEFTGDHRLVLSAAADETVRLWDLDRARCCRCPTSSGCVCESSCLARYSCTDGIPWSVEFGPFGYHFLVGNQGGTSTLYSTDRLSVLRVFRGHTSDVTCSSFHPNAAYVATGSDDGSVRLWDIRDATQGSIRQMNLTQSSTGAAVTSLKCSPCGSLLAVGYYDGTAAVWDVPTGRLAYLLQDDPGDLENGAVSSSDRPMRNRLTQKQIYALQFDHATSRLATGGQDCAVKLWDLNVASGQRDTYSHCLLKPRISFHTKFTPVYAMSGFQSLKDTGAVLVAGGPSSIARITP
jgi:WD40 repeat protein